MLLWNRSQCYLTYSKRFNMGDEETPEATESSCVLSNEILEECISQKYLNGDATVQVTAVEVTTPDVVHFVSTVEYVDVSYQITGEEDVIEIPLFLKKPSVIPRFKEVAEKLQSYEKEERFFSEILPALKELADGANEPISLNFIPTPLYHQDNIILMINYVKDQGFNMNEVTSEGLNLEQVELVLKRLADFHSLTYALKMNKDDLTDKYPLDMLAYGSAAVEDYGLWYTSLLTSMASLLKESSEENEEMVDHLTQYAPQLVQAAKSCYEPDDQFNLICHGDLWMNNLLFGDPENVRLVDYQYICFAPLAIDLINFLWSCTTPEFRQDNMEQILQTYYDAFIANLANLNIDTENVFTLEALTDDFNKRKHYGLLFAVPLLLFTFAPSDFPEDYTNSDVLTAYAEDIVNRDEYKDHIIKTLPQLYNEVKDNILTFLQENNVEEE